MKIKTVTLDDLTRSVLMRSTIDGCNLTLPGQLPREDYVRVAKAIEAAGGKWNRKAGCHVFPQDVRETLDITEGSVEVVNVKQTFQAFYTPADLAYRMVKLACIEPGHLVLEPSVGMGAIAKEIIDQVDTEIVGYEIDPKKVAHCDKTFPSYRLQTRCRDFLEVTEGQGQFDRVVMNPPFTGGQDIAHIKHADTFLKRGGKMVAICSNGPRQREQLQPLADEWIYLEPGTFSESGTNVNAAMLVISR